MTTPPLPRLRRFRVRVAGLVAALAALAVLLTTVVAPAGGASGEIEQRDGVVTWNVNGRATVDLTWPEAAVCGGAPCVELGDALAAAADRAGCVSLGRATFAVRCALGEARTLRVVGSGNLPVIVNAAAPAAGCPSVEVVIVQGASNGATNVQDGCPQTIECAIYYSGTVHADRGDTIGGDCHKVRVEGSPAREQGIEEPCATPGRGCAPDRGAAPPITDTKPITGPTGPPQPGGPSGGPGALRVVTASRLSRSGRALRARVTVTQPAQIGVRLQRRTPKGRWVQVRSASRTATKGTTSVLFRASRKHPIRPGTYRTRVTVSAPGTKPVVSKVVRMRG